MSDTAASLTNVPEFSVGDLAFSLKRTLEEQYGRIRVRGELSRVSIASSGHMYSSLKDENAVIDAVCWKGVLSKIALRPEEGLEVIVTGRISTYPQRSNYQLIIEDMELAGEGALLKMLEERKKRLAAEGLFAPERKRALPFLPKVIGVVTSPTGAVIRDILHRLNDRFPRHVIVWPVLVQGQGAAEQVAQAIEGFQSLEEHGLPRPDVLIVARGGGSLEDLMPFNEEIVVRAVAGSAIPVISAVGHETDTTLCDYAADVRAPTPTGAAEIAVPVRAQLASQIMDDGQRLHNGLYRLLEEKRSRAEGVSARLGDPSRLLENYAQRVDHLGARLSGIFGQYLSTKRERLARTALHSPESGLREAGARLERWGERLSGRGEMLTKDFGVRLSHAEKMLEAYSFHKTLERGFTVVRDGTGAVVSEAGVLKSGAGISIEFKGDQRIGAVVSGGGSPAKTPSKKGKTISSDQQSLF